LSPASLPSDGIVAGTLDFTVTDFVCTDFVCTDFADNFLAAIST
jgi:hypothetical protein